MRLLSSLITTSMTIIVANAAFKPEFNKWVAKHYGAQRLTELTRSDIGGLNGGSFGGGRTPTKRRPVVLVHGVRNKAANLWNHINVLETNGWAKDHILGTTYGPGEVDAARGLQESMKCSYVKQVRHMLEATIKFYRSNIDVVAFSLGSPIARKAILGGHCVDTHEYIGRPLTKRIGTYISVAGANRGSYLCGFAYSGICNGLNGLACNSKFLTDINSKSGYEGRHRYTIASPSDDVTGFSNVCGQRVHAFAGSAEIIKSGLNHNGVIHHTIQDQANILKKHNRV